MQSRETKRPNKREPQKRNWVPAEGALWWRFGSMLKAVRSFKARGARFARIARETLSEETCGDIDALGR